MLGVLLIGCSLQVAFAQTGKRRALLVGLGPYSKYTGFRDLRGAGDCEKFKTQFLRHWGFTDKEIHIIPNEKATKKAIIDEFENWLVKDAKKGDTLVFYFSGHGTLVPAPELNTRVRSAILPIDTKVNGDQDIVPSSVITGAFFKNWQVKLKKESGFTDLTMFFDACNSAAIDRGLGIAKFVANPAAERALGTRDTSNGPTLSEEIDLSDFVTVFAAKASRAAYEGPEGGNLTVALCDAVQSFINLQPTQKVSHDLSFSVLKDLTLAKMSFLPQATPQEPGINGNEGRLVFGGPTTRSERSFLVTTATGPTPGSKLVTIASGAIYGTRKGHEFSLYKAGDIQRVTPLATGTVVEVATVTSKLQLDPEFKGDMKALYGGRAVLTDSSSDPKIGLDLSELTSSHSELRDKLKALPCVEVTTTNPNLIVLPPGSARKGFEEPGRDWHLVDAVGNKKMERLGDISPDLAFERLAESIKNTARSAAILNLQPTKSKFKVEMEIVPVKTRLVGTEETAIVAQKLAGSKSLAILADSKEDSDRFVVRVRARYFDGSPVPSQSIFINILNVTPDGKLGRAWPHRNSPLPQESTRLVCDGVWSYLGVAGLTPESQPEGWTIFFEDPCDGYGYDVLKLLATDVFVDYDPEEPASRNGMKGRNSRLGQILADFDEAKPVSRSGFKRQPLSDYSVDQVTITVHPRTRTGKQAR